MSALQKLPYKVIGFDSWTGGNRHYKRLIPAFREQGLELLLIHLGSWGVDKGRTKEEWMEELHVRDISYYGNRSFSEILDLEQPSVVLFLSTDTFAHRAFNRLARAKGMPTIHLYHGLMSALAVDVAKPYDRNLVSYFWFVTSRIVKMFTKVWPSYVNALLSTHANWDEWKRFFTDNIDLLLGRDRLDSALDARTDLCCIYTDGDREHAESRYGFNDEEVVDVGNPDIVQFGLCEELIGPYLERTEECHDIIYIDTALLLRGATFSNQEDFVDHLIETKKAVNRIGKRLLVKLHPDHFKTDTPDRLRQRGVKICQNDQFIARLQSCCAVIVEPSSAAIIPALMGLPLLLARYGNLRHQNFGKILREYPIGIYLDEVNYIQDKLKSLVSRFHKETVVAWISRNSGPLPAELMPKRVAQVVVDLVNRK